MKLIQYSTIHKKKSKQSHYIIKQENDEISQNEESDTKPFQAPTIVSCFSLSERLVIKAKSTYR